MIDLSIQKELNADPKEIQLIEFVQQLENTDCEKLMVHNLQIFSIFFRLKNFGKKSRKPN